jgi:hypothetical protein
MIDLIQFLSPYVPIEDHSHIMVVEIVMESMVMMKAAKSPSSE